MTQGSKIFLTGSRKLFPAQCVRLCNLFPIFVFQETSMSTLGTERLGHIVSDPRQKE